MTARVGESCSDPLPVFGGILQGSILGVMLFNVTMEDLEEGLDVDTLAGGPTPLPHGVVVRRAGSVHGRADRGLAEEQSPPPACYRSSSPVQTNFPGQSVIDLSPIKGPGLVLEEEDVNGNVSRSDILPSRENRTPEPPLNGSRPLPSPSNTSMME